jgi:hypothetical protein
MLKGDINMKEKEIIKLRNAIAAGLEKDKVIHSSMINPLTDYILGQWLIKGFDAKMEMNQEGLEDEKLNYIKAFINKPLDMSSLCAGSKGRVVDEALETMNRMAEEGHLIKGVDYHSTKRIDDEFCLKLNYATFYDRFEKYCLDNNISHEVLSLKDFKQELQHREYCLHYNRPVNFRTGDYLNNSKTFRAAVLSIEKLEEQNLNLDYLINGQE